MPQGILDFSGMAQQLGLLSPVADKYNPLSESINPQQGWEGGRGYGGTAGGAPAKLYRGIVEDYQSDGTPGLGTYHLGKGLYSSPSKSFAKGYATNGKVLELSPEEAYPKNPLRLNGTGGAKSLFMDYVFKTTDFPNAREFNKAYPDPADFLRARGFDGVHIGDEVVKFPTKD